MRRGSQRRSRRSDARNLDHDGCGAEYAVRGSSRVRPRRTDATVTADERARKAARTADPREVPGRESNAGEEVLRRAGSLTAWRQRSRRGRVAQRSEEHTSELQSQSNLVCRLLLE